LSVQIERVKIAVVSLQQRAAMFDVRWSQGDIAGKGKDSQQEDSEGSIWSNEACLSELLCLLPIVTSRCPSLLTPGDEVLLLFYYFIIYYFLNGMILWSKLTEI
jgi:hypothetical protein